MLLLDRNEDKNNNGEACISLKKYEDGIAVIDDDTGSIGAYSR